MDATDAEVLRRIGALPGVGREVRLEPAEVDALRRRRTEGSARNAGLEEVLARSRMVCLFKDTSFRPPPEPTLLLIDDGGEVLGRELLPGDAAPADRRVAYLGKDFVLFAGVRPRGGYRFVLPPVRFPELETVSAIVRVVSASPDTPQDEYLRTRFGVLPGRELASVLVGYDLRNP